MSICKNAIIRSITSVFVVLFLTAWVSCAHAEAKIKPDRVHLLTGIPSPCISIEMSNATVVLSISDLERLANATPSSWTTESESLAMIDGGRAKEILASTSGSIDTHACLVSSGNISGGSYLIAHMLEKGEVAVLNKMTGVLVPEITVKKTNNGSAGFIEFYLPESSKSFLILILWMS